MIYSQDIFVRIF